MNSLVLSYRKNGEQMAITKIFPVRQRLDHLLDYIADINKTENPDFGEMSETNSSADEQFLFVSGINCSPETAYESMRATFALNDKPLRVHGYHVIQSFAPGETDATTAHEIGIRMAQDLWGERYQVMVATHLNTDALHNHIVFCSTSFIDGTRYHSCKASYRELREVSDRYCREHQLSVIENPQTKRYKSFAEHQAERTGKPTWRTIIKGDVDEAIARATTDRAFFKNLENIGYAVKLGEDISVRPPGKERFMRLERNFGEGYSRDSINRRILAQRPVVPIRKPRATDPRPKKLPPVPKGSILALIRYYLYLYGYYKRRPTDAQNRRMHYLLREDIRKLDSIVSDASFMEANGIETRDQLDNFKAEAVQKIELLVTERQPLYRTARKAEYPKSAASAGERITVINSQLKTLRKQLRQCGRIAERSESLRDMIEQIEKDIEPPAKERTSRKYPNRSL